MRGQIAKALCLAGLGLMASSSLAITQQKTAGTCREEWQANKATNQSSGVTKRVYVAQCQARGVLTQPAFAAFAAVSRNAAGDRQVYSSVKELMESIIDPSADVLWGAVGTVADKEGVHELLPKTQEEWLDVRRAAVRIIEGGNLLLMPGREAAPPGTRSEVPGVELEPAEMTQLIKKQRKSFDAFAKALQALGLEALRAADAKDGATLIEIGGRMENVCEGCHQTFWYPQAKAASTRK